MNEKLKRLIDATDPKLFLRDDLSAPELIAGWWKENPANCEQIVRESVVHWKRMPLVAWALARASDEIQSPAYCEVLFDCATGKNGSSRVRTQILEHLVEESWPDAVKHFKNHFSAWVDEIEKCPGRGADFSIGNTIETICLNRLSECLPELERFQKFLATVKQSVCWLETQCLVGAAIIWFREGANSLVPVAAGQRHCCLIFEKTTSGDLQQARSITWDPRQSYPKVMPVEGVRGLLQDLFPVLRPIPYVRSNERAEAIFCLGCAGRADLYQFYWECEAVSRPWFLTSFAMRRRTIQTIVAACHPADVSEYLVSAIRDETTDRRLNRRRHNNALGCLLAGARYAPDIPDDLRELLLFWLGATNLHIAAAAWIALREHGYAVDIEGRKSLQEAIQAENAFVADERHIYGLMRISQRRRLRSDS